MFIWLTQFAWYQSLGTNVSLMSSDTISRLILLGTLVDCRHLDVVWHRWSSMFRAIHHFKWFIFLIKFEKLNLRNLIIEMRLQCRVYCNLRDDHPVKNVAGSWKRELEILENLQIHFVENLRTHEKRTSSSWNQTELKLTVCNGVRFSYQLVLPSK